MWKFSRLMTFLCEGSFWLSHFTKSWQRGIMENYKIIPRSKNCLDFSHSNLIKSLSHLSDWSLLFEFKTKALFLFTLSETPFWTHSELIFLNDFWRLFWTILSKSSLYIILSWSFWAYSEYQYELIFLNYFWEVFSRKETLWMLQS